MVRIEDCCQNCGQVKASLYQCSQCKIVSYCSKNCERKHKKEHSRVCFTPETIPNQINPSAESKVTYSNEKIESNDEKTDNKKESLKDSSNGKAKNFCQTCFRTNVPLQNCLRCKTTYYCSTVCQKCDWPTHKSNCKTPEMNTEAKSEESGHEYSKEGSNKKDPVKDNCMSGDKGNGGEVDSIINNKNKKKRNRRKKCKNVNSVNIENDGATSKTDIRNEIDEKESGTKASKENTGNINYKGKDGGIDSEKEASKKGKNKERTVQVKNKEDIKKTGAINTEEKNDARTTVKNTAEKCDNCGNFDEHLMKCAKCKTAKYCSKSCQSSAWPLHKKSCKPAHLTGEAEKCENCGKLDAHLMKCVKCKTAKYCSKSCQSSAWPLHKKSCKSSNNSNDAHSTEKDYFHRSILRAAMLFPSYKIFTKFINIENENQQLNGKEKTLLLALVLQESDTNYRKKYIIIDTDGYQRCVVFYLKELDPHPYFSWDQMKAGNFVCILKPIIRPEYQFYIIESAEQLRVFVQ